MRCADLAGMVLGVAERGVHVGSNALQRSGVTDAPADWLTALWVARR